MDGRSEGIRVGDVVGYEEGTLLGDAVMGTVGT